MRKSFTINELRNFNGLNDKPAYIAFKGTVYDVSNVFKSGEHAGVKAGTDITDIFAQGPHKEEMFTKLPVVGVLQTKQNLLQKICAVTETKSLLILRLALGIIFFAHGSQKLLGWFGGYGWTGTIAFFTKSIGIPAFPAGISILVEFFCGIVILLGLFTRPAAFALAINLLVAAFTVHLRNGFFLNSPNDGVEYVFALFMLSVYLLIKGSGLISLDQLLAQRLSKRE